MRNQLIHELSVTPLMNRMNNFVAVTTPKRKPRRDGGEPEECPLQFMSVSSRVQKRWIYKQEIESHYNFHIFGGKTTLYKLRKICLTFWVYFPIEFSSREIALLGEENVGPFRSAILFHATCGMKKYNWSERCYDLSIEIAAFEHIKPKARWLARPAEMAFWQYHYLIVSKLRSPLLDLVPILLRFCQFLLGKKWCLKYHCRFQG